MREVVAARDAAENEESLLRSVDEESSDEEEVSGDSGSDEGEEEEEDSSGDEDEDGENEEEEEEEEGGEAGGDDKLAEEARQQWIDRGFDPEDFTPEKMYDIWAKEEEEGVGRTRGMNNLQRKKELIQARQDARVFNPEVLKARAKAKAVHLKEQAKDFVLETKSQLTPQFLKRRFELKKYEERVKNRIEQAKEQHKRRMEIQRAKEEKLAQEKIDTEKRLEELARLEEFKAFEKREKLQADFLEKKKRSDNIVEQRQQALDDARRKKEEKERAEEERKLREERTRLSQNLKNFKLQARSAAKELAIKEKEIQDRDAARKKSLAEFFERETRSRAAQEEEDQFYQPKLSSPNPGIFHPAIGPNEVHGTHDVNRPAFNKLDPELDAEQSELFSTDRVSTIVPEMEARLMHAESETAKAQDVLTAASVHVHSLEEEGRALREQIEKLRSDVAEIDHEDAAYKTLLLGPPRRDPIAAEMDAADKRARRKFDLLRLVGEAEESSRVKASGDSSAPEQLVPRLAKVEQQLERAQSELDKAKEAHAIRSKESTALRQQLDAYLDERQELPIVMGRALHTVEEMKGQPAANPVQELGYVLQRTHAELLKNATKALEGHQKDLARMAHKKWAFKEEQSALRGELELSKNRLASVEARIRTERHKRLRTDLVVALQSFFHRGGFSNLQKVDLRYNGVLDWWADREQSSCRNVSLLEREQKQVIGANFSDVVAHIDQKQLVQSNGLNGVILEQGHARGHIEGTIYMPKHRLWRCRFSIIRKTFGGRLSNFDPNDFVNVKLGPSLGALKLVGKYSNVRQDARRVFRHSIDHLLVGNALSYRFEFSSVAAKNCLVIENGWFEQDVPPPVEVVNPETNQVLTDFIKILRVEMHQGRQRSVYLLEEITRAKNSTEQFWDSNTLSGTHQRFERRTLIKLLEAELKKELKAQKEAYERRMARRAALLKMADEKGKGEPAPANEQHKSSDVENNSNATKGKNLLNIAGHDRRKQKGQNVSKEAEQHRKMLRHRLKNKTRVVDDKKETLLEAKMRRAKERYVFRKRKGVDSKQALEQGQALVGKKVEVFFEDIGRWRVGKVMEMKSEWVDQNTRLYITHRILYSDQMNKTKQNVADDVPEQPTASGNTRAELDIDEEDEEESSQTAGVWDELLVRRYVDLKTDTCDVEELRRVTEREQREKEAREAQERLAVEQAEEKELEEIKLRGEQDARRLLEQASDRLARVADRARRDARFLLTNDPELRRQVLEEHTDEDTINELIAEEGVIAGNSALARAATETLAEDSFVDSCEKRAVAEAKEEWDFAMKNHKRRLAEKLRDFEERKRRRREQELEDKANRMRESEKKMNAKHKELSKLLAIVDIHSSTPSLLRCEHRRVRYWGTQYNKGIRCLQCHQELSRSHQDPSQAWETDVAIGEAVSRNRRDETRFSHDSLEQLQVVLEERWRVEKEDREIQVSDPRRFDSTLSKQMRKLNERHLINTANRLPVDDISARNDEELFEAQPLRVALEQRLALRRDYLEHFARVGNYGKKLSALTDRKNELAEQRKAVLHDLELAHRDCVLLERRVDLIEQEYFRAEQKLKRRKDMGERVAQCEKELERALQKRASAELKSDAANRELLQAEANYETKAAIAREAMLQEQVIIAERDRVKERLSVLGEQVEERRTELDEAEITLRTIRWQQRGRPVLCSPWSDKLGVATTLHCRPANKELGTFDMVKMRVIFGDDAEYWRHERARKRAKREKVPFAKPRPTGYLVATVFTALEPIIQAELARESAELKLMRTFDAESRSFREAEKAFVEANCQAMTREEQEQRAVDEIKFEFAAENRAAEQARQEAMANAVQVVSLKWKRNQLKRMAKERVEQEHQALVEARRKVLEAGGPDAELTADGMPNGYTKKRRRRLARKYYQEFVVLFQDEQGDLADEETRARFAALRARNVERAAIESIIREMVDQEAKQVVAQYHRNSLEAAQRRMDDSNIFVLRNVVGEGAPQSDVHFEVYTRLASLRRGHQIQLERMLNNWSHHAELERERIAQQLAWEARQEERDREEAEADLMFAEDMALRAFYKEERQKCLEERWAMADEEAYMREIMRQEALRAMKSKYDVIPGIEPEEKSKKAMRRDEIKKRVADRQRAAREQKLMALEDELGVQMRVDYNRQMQQLLLQHELGGLDDDGEDEAAQMANAKLLRAQNREVEKQRRLLEEEDRRYAQRVNESFLERLGAELELLRAEDQFCKYAVLAERKQQLAFRATVFMKNRLDHKIKSAQKVKSYRATALQSGVDAEKYLATVDAARPALRKVLHEQLVVKRDTEFMRSSVMHDSEQRFPTEKLYKDLHYHFFWLLSSQIANGAEVTSIERKLRALVGELQGVVKQIDGKEAALKRVQLQYRRTQWLQLRRSELGKVLFGHSQVQALLRAFKGWQGVATWQRTTRDAFKAKMGLRKHALDIDRHNKANNNQQTPEQIAAEAAKDSRTIMQKHKTRKIKCRFCQKTFTEASNHGKACAYHPGKYAVACPKTCTNNSNSQGGSIDTRCAPHYRRRWSCCDQTKAVPFGEDGCQQRWHVAVDIDEDYLKLAEKAERETSDQLERARTLTKLTDKWKGFAKSRRFDELDSMRSVLANDRKVASQYSQY